MLQQLAAALTGSIDGRRPRAPAGDSAPLTLHRRPCPRPWSVTVPPRTQSWRGSFQRRSLMQDRIRHADMHDRNDRS